MSENEEHRLIAQRREKLSKLREKGNPYPNDFRRDAHAAELIGMYGGHDNDWLEKEMVRVRIGGRMMAKRIMGKASFAHLQDSTGQIQIYLQRDSLPDSQYQQFKSWDIGDIVGGEGVLFKTKTGELSVRVHNIRLLSKSLRPLPEKFHGLADQEIRYRQRYVDLIMNEDTRRVFEMRTRIVQYIREFMNSFAFMEVETPMMQAIPGGAIARPFKTHHNALDIDLYMRIAPELYLKRLIVGGFEKVYEINRSFRNEGISARHNPEFTMLEFYWAYADFNDLMNLTEQMMRGLAELVGEDACVTYQGEALDFGKPFKCMTLRESLLAVNPELDVDRLDDKAYLQEICRKLEIPVDATFGEGKLLIEMFEKTVELNLKEPTFITSYPTDVSPLSRRSDSDPKVVDRFELFVGGKEIANGFSELNDPEDQATRFKEQASRKSAGDQKAMFYDDDYIRALEYGMPPTAGEGIGIDRLVMLLTDSPSIRDVLLFPLLRPETPTD